MAEIFLTSDLHYNHINILTFCSRPFEDLEQMNQGLVDNWNSVVSPEDTVYLLGDFAMGKREDSLQYLAQLRGHIIWVPGNHDYWHPMHKAYLKERWHEIYSQYAELADTTIELDEFLLCHFPYWDTQRHGGQYDHWLPDDGGKWLLHGHIHSGQPWDLERPRCYDVGVDANNYTPVHIDHIRTSIKLFEQFEMVYKGAVS